MKVDLYGACAGAGVYHDIYPVIFHGRVQVFFHHGAEPVNLVNEQHVLVFQVGQQTCQVARSVVGDDPGGKKNGGVCAIAAHRIDEGAGRRAPLGLPAVDEGALEVRGVAAEAPDLEVRAFAAPIGIDEDPVTGSLNASLAEWLIAEGHMPARYLAAQGARIDRAGRVSIERDDSGKVWVGGASVTCISGTVAL